MPVNFMGGLVHQDVAQLARRRRNIYTSETFLKTSGFPSGYGPGESWLLPQKSGGLASFTGVTGISAISLLLSAGVNSISSVSGSGELSANGALIVSALASIVASSTMTSDLKAKVEAIAALSGSGDVYVTISALAFLLCSLTGAGSATLTPYAVGNVSAGIKSYGDLSPEGIRDAIWNALSSGYNQPGSMGAQLNQAANAAGITPADVWNYLVSVAPNKTAAEALLKIMNEGLTTKKFVALQK